MVYCLAQATTDVPQIDIQPQVLKREGIEQQQKLQSMIVDRHSVSDARKWEGIKSSEM
jgi:hypothetical protein